MSSNRRKRDYERRRYEEWQRKLAEKNAQRQRRRRNGAVAGAALGVVAVVLGGVFLITRDSGDSAKPSAAEATPTPSASPSASASPDPDNPCPPPDVQPPAEPITFPKVADKSTAAGKRWALTLTTNCGPIVLSLDGAKAPQATAAMLQLGKSEFFKGSPCHRLTTSGIFVLQCGDPTGTGTGGPGFNYGPVENAPKGDLYPAGTVAMARQGGNGNSMGSQFFLVYKDSTIPSDAGGGYTVLGTIKSGQDIVDTIAAGGVDGGASDGAPKRAISILSTSVAPG